MLVNPSIFYLVKIRLGRTANASPGSFMILINPSICYLVKIRLRTVNAFFPLPDLR
jgi:hypothetical protein